MFFFPVHSNAPHYFEISDKSSETSAMLFTILLVSFFSTFSNGDPLFTFCSNEYANYSSQFEANVKHVLDDLSSNIIRNISLPSFYNSIGDKVYGQALCRGDVNSTECQKCVENASQDIFRNCKSRDAMIWYERCQVRYSFQNFFSTMTYTGKLPKHNYQEKNVSDPIRFSEVVMYLMNKLSNETSFSPSKHMFATGQVKFRRKETIYGLLQCTTDVSPALCKNCLDSALGDLTACCSFRQGGIVVSRNCNMRFELYKFYNDTSNLLLVYPFSKGKDFKTSAIVISMQALLLFCI